MARKHPNEHTDDSEHGPKKVRGPNNKRREGPATRGRNQEDGSVSRSERIEQSRELEDSFRKLSDAHKAAVSELRETQNNYKNQQQEINSLNNKLRDISTLLDVRNRELKVAKTFLSMEDLFSTSDVVQTVRDLNSEVMQTAALLTDNLTLKRVRDHQIGAIPEGPYKPVFVVLAFPQVSGDEVDAALLELALQSYFIVWVYWMANAWGFYEASGWCDELYSKVREKEDPAVASNWRSLTRRTLFSIDSSSEDLPHQVVNGAIDRLASLLSFCGVGEPLDNARSIRKHAVEKFGLLFTASQKLNKMIGQNIVSGDLAVTIIGAGYPFDSEHMEDAYHQGGAKPDRLTVICTTGLGLCERNSKGQRIFLKPKVVLSDC